MAQHTVGRPLAKAHLADVDGLDPRRRLRLGDLRGARAERRRARRIGANDRIEQRFELGEQRVVESRADAARVDERRRRPCRRAAARRGWLRLPFGSVNPTITKSPVLLRLDLEPVVACGRRDTARRPAWR